MDILAIAGLAGFILVKETGVPLPVPGDLVIIGAGATLAGDLPGAGLVLGVILVAGFIGASIQFLLFNTALRRPLLGVLKRLGVGEERLERLSTGFLRGGARSVAVARMTPGVRIAVIPAAAVAALPYLVFLAGIIAGNGVFVSAHFGLGFVFGAYAKDLFERFGGYALIGVVVLVVLAVAGWLIIRARRRAAAQTDSYECWADCSCPACVAIVSSASRRQPSAG
ncbi:MAG TPA: VTT domain-containing protein [Candidatus Limnocylindria bacterium]